MKAFRGSRLHVLDWVSTPQFASELTAMLAPTGAVVTNADHWMPVSHTAATEARLETFGPEALPGAIAWEALRDWWLAHPKGANTPNWDLASTCTIGGRRGLVLIEAKANIPELSDAGKAPYRPPKGFTAEQRPQSRASKDNDTRIAQAIEEARVALAQLHPGVSLSRDTHYQLSNRVAFAWKLASLGLPTVLVYLGFTGDTRFKKPLRDGPSWVDAFREHVKGVIPEGLREVRVDCGAAPFWLLVRDRGVKRVSPRP